MHTDDPRKVIDRLEKSDWRCVDHMNAVSLLMSGFISWNARWLCDSVALVRMELSQSKL